MSDSHKEENNAHAPDRSGNSVKNAKNSPGRSKASDHAQAELLAAQKKARRAEIESAAGIRQRTLLLWLLTGLVAIALAGFAWVIVSQWPTPDNVREASGDQSAHNNSVSDKNVSNEPISILPTNPEGVTVLEKQAESSTGQSGVVLAPIAQGADIATGFAMDLGAASSFQDLTRRFANIQETNGQENFQRLEPRAVLRDTITGLEARLLVGPFETREDADEACAVLILEEQIVCTSALFEGDLIPRN